MTITYDSSKGDYFSWNAKSREIFKDGKPLLNVVYLAKVEGRYFEINLQLLSEEKDLKTDSLKRVIIDTAHLVHRLITSSNSPEIVTVSYGNRFASKQVTNWTGRDSATSCEEQNDVDEKIVSFSAKCRFSSEPSEMKRVASIYHQTVQDQVLQKDIYELLSVLPAIVMAETQVQEVVFEFMTIKDPIKRTLIVNEVKKAYSFRSSQGLGFAKEWIACMPLSIRACKELPDGKEPSMENWGPILDMVHTYEEPLQTLKTWNIDAQTQDGTGTSLLEFAARDYSQRYYPIARELLKTQCIDKYNYGKLFEIACALEDLDTVNKIIAFVAMDDNRYLPTSICLQKAIEKKLVALVEVLVKTLRSEDVSYHKLNGRSLVSFAIQKRNPAILRIILSIPGIDVNSESYGYTPLEDAVYSDKFEVLQLVLQAPDINLDINDELFLRVILHDNEQIAELFLSHPKMKWSMIAKYLDDRPALAIHKNINLIAQYFPEEFKQWLDDHPEIEISNLIIEDNFDLAESKLDSLLESRVTFPIIPFMKSDPKIKSFVMGPYKGSLSRWLVKNHVLETMNLEEQYFILEELDPNFFQYISAGKQGYQLLDRSLGPKGIELIVEYLRNKPDPSLPKEDCVSVCPDYIAFEEVLAKLAQGHEIKDGYCHYFIVLETENNPHRYGAHVTPLFFKKTNGKWEVVITDSTTDYSNRTKHTGPLIQRINKTKGAYPGFAVERIYVSTFWRQVDDSTCPIFALRDIVYFYRHGNGFLQNQTANPNEQIHYFSDFPPEMMKANQSVREIKEYAEQRKRNGLSVTMATRKPPGTETILENLNRHIEIVKSQRNQIRNELAEKRSIKYKKIIMNHLINRFTTSIIA